MANHTRLITEGEFARLCSGLTLEMLSVLTGHKPGTVRVYELRGCCWGTANQLARITGSRMEAYLNPRMVEISREEYLALKAKANVNMEKTSLRRNRVAALLGITSNRKGKPVRIAVRTSS